MRKYLTEFIGTFFLVLVIGMTAVLNTPLAPIAIGAILMTMIYMGGHVSGAHYNPAVSLAALVRGRLSAVDFVVYLIVQVFGALAASLVVWVILAGTFGPQPTFKKPGLFETDLLGVLMCEFLMTFALALVVLNAATAKGTAGNSFYGLAIGFTVMAGAFAVGPISGGAFNPAVATGPNVMRAIINSGGELKLVETVTELWIYWAAPLAGGFAAGIVFRVQNPDDV